MTNTDKLIQRALEFRDSRDWKQFHNIKDMIISLSLESSELLELTQWKNNEDILETLKNNKEDFSDELMDVLYWVLLICNDLNIDINKEFERKIQKSEKNYPIEKCKGSCGKYTDKE